ncbi:MAG: ImmA/IrrE family metallo-endopeptidase [Deltaproteobacteria bacterium]|jgi:Zn-dependent peptidase ImmA (M78 family)|nr:ImmA/IrrE family metallo-endopeptidase [Deltaproteobacteria bacterium]
MSNEIAYINKNTLQKLREHYKFVLDDFAKITEISPKNLRYFEDNSHNSYPSFNQIKRIASLLNKPFISLFLDFDLIYPMFKQFDADKRIIYGTDTYNEGMFNLFVEDLLIKRDIYYECQKNLGQSIEKIDPKIFDIYNSNLIVLANNIRNYFNIDINIKLNSMRKYYLYIVKLIEDKNIFIQNFRAKNLETARGIAIYDRILPIIGVNIKDKYPAKLFTIFHELVHILIKNITICSNIEYGKTSDKEEIYCNLVAAETLAPRKLIFAELRDNNIQSPQLKDINEMSAKFHVSNEVIIRRLYDFKIINKEQYFRFISTLKMVTKQLKENNKDKNKGFNNYKYTLVDSNSQKLCVALLNCFTRGFINKFDIGDYLDFDYKYTDGFLKEVSNG